MAGVALMLITSLPGLRRLSCVLLILLFWLPPQVIAEDDFTALLQQLDAADFAQKGQAVERIARSGHPRAELILSELLEGNLQTRRDDGTVVIAISAGRNFELTDALSGENLGIAGRRDISRISVNNALRSQIRTALARVALSAPDRKSVV